MITVVAAVIERDRRFLVTRRQEGVHLAGLWEFPGGKVSPGEAHAAALRREMLEELDADVRVGELILHTTHVYPEATVALYFYACELLGTPRPQLGQQMQWASPDLLARLGFPDADAELIRRLTTSDAP